MIRWTGLAQSYVAHPMRLAKARPKSVETPKTPKNELNPRNNRSSCNNINSSNHQNSNTKTIKNRRSSSRSPWRRGAARRRGPESCPPLLVEPRGCMVGTAITGHEWVK